MSKKQISIGKNEIGYKQVENRDGSVSLTLYCVFTNKDLVTFRCDPEEATRSRLAIEFQSIHDKALDNKAEIARAKQTMKRFQ